MNGSKIKIRYFLFLLFIINVLPSPAKANRGSESDTSSKRIFRAGAAVGNITPPLDEPIVGGWNSPPATHVHDELYAKCLVLDDGRTQLVFVVCDNLGICAIPFEVFVEIGLEIKAKSPFAQTFTISLANGSYGYLPTVAQHELGGYETWLGTNKVEIQAAPKIVRMLMSIVNNQ